MIKMNDDNKELKPEPLERIVCPVCGTTAEIIRIGSVYIDGTPVILHEDVGKVYQCLNPECMNYLLRVDNKFNPIEKFELLRRQKEITDLLTKEAEISKAMLHPKGYITAMRAEMGDVLSSVLYHLTSSTNFHRAYTVEETLEACEALGFNPRQVDNSRIKFVLSWLKENKQ
jgi:hypothetical protein